MNVPQQRHTKRTFRQGVTNRLLAAKKSGGVLSHVRALLRSSSEATSLLRSRKMSDGTIGRLKEVQQEKVRACVFRQLTTRCLRCRGLVWVPALVLIFFPLKTALSLSCGDGGAENPLPVYIASVFTGMVLAVHVMQTAGAHGDSGKF